MLEADQGSCRPAWLFEAGIISPKFYTTLVVVAVLTSQMAGASLDYVLAQRWPLLTSVTDRPQAKNPGIETPLAR